MYNQGYNASNEIGAARAIPSGDFQPKERRRRSMEEQIIFNTERIAMLHKELSELRAMLESYTIVEPQTENPVMDRGIENNSPMMNKLMHESLMINELIDGVVQMKRNLQL